MRYVGGLMRQRPPLWGRTGCTQRDAPHRCEAPWGLLASDQGERVDSIQNDAEYGDVAPRLPAPRLVRKRLDISRVTLGQNRTNRRASPTPNAGRGIRIFQRQCLAASWVWAASSRCLLFWSCHCRYFDLPVVSLCRVPLEGGWNPRITRFDCDPAKSSFQIFWRQRLYLPYEGGLTCQHPPLWGRTECTQRGAPHR